MFLFRGGGRGEERPPQTEERDASAYYEAAESGTGLSRCRVMASVVSAVLGHSPSALSRLNFSEA